jgi:Cys-rich repeat protein
LPVEWQCRECSMDAHCPTGEVCDTQGQCQGP